MAAVNEQLDETVEAKSADGASMVLNTKPLFKLMVERKASDLFFTSNSPIKVKIEGSILPINKQVLTPETVRQAAYGLMSPDQLESFKQIGRASCRGCVSNTAGGGEVDQRTEKC